MFSGGTLIFILQILISKFNIKVPYYRVLLTSFSLYLWHVQVEPTFFDGIWLGITGTYIISFLWVVICEFWHEFVFVKDNDDNYIDDICDDEN